MDLSTTYWLNWRVLLCTLWILTSIALAAYVIKRHEGPRQRNIEEEDHLEVLYENQVWRTFSKQIHPAFLCAYRLCVLILIFLLDMLSNVFHGAVSFYFYTQWTVALCSIYFLIGTMFSTCGWWNHRQDELDEEQGRPRRVAGFCAYGFQIIYQMLAGVVVLTNCLYWFIVVPSQVTILHRELDFIEKTWNSVSIVFFLGEAALNNMPFPWFRIAYFGLWTCMYVVFQWIFHACRAGFGWPYFFHDLRYPFAPLSYFIVVLSHFPCYGVIYVLIKLKHVFLKNLVQD